MMVSWFLCAGEFLDAHNGAVTAFATIFIAIFTIVLACVSRAQARLTRDAIKLARDEFNATHRPRLIVRRISLKEVHGEGGLPSIGGIEYVVVNKGVSKAKIVESNTTILYDAEANRFPAIAPYSDETSAIGNIQIEGGGSYPFTHNDNERILSQIIPVPGRRQMTGLDLLFIGYIVYEDDIGIRRQTAFCRRYNHATDRFSIVDDPEYEYAD
jgi:hypothetical protein